MRNDQLSSALVSILRKFEIMTESVMVSNEQNYLVLSSVDSVMQSNQSELKKQTSLLTSINNAIKGKTKSAFKNDKVVEESQPSADFSKLKDLAPSFLTLVEAGKMIDNNTGTKIEKFLLSLNNGLIEFSKIDATNAEGVSSILGGVADIADKITMFGKNLALYNLYAPLADRGAVLFQKSINTLLKGLSGIKKTQISTLETINTIAENIATFGKNLALFVLLAKPANLGAKLFQKTVNILLNGLSGIKDDELKGIDTLMSIGKGILMFGGSLALFALLSVPVLLGLGVAYLAILGISGIMKIMGSKEIEIGTKSLIKAGLGVVLLGLSLFAFNVLVDPAKSFMSLLVLGGVGLVFGFIGLMGNQINKGAAAMTFAALPILLLSGAMYIWQKADVKMSDVGTLLALVGGTGLLMGLAGLAFPYIAAGSLAMILGSTAILLMSVALEKFQTLNWTESNSDNLSYTIKSVLGALSGTSADKTLSQNIGGAVGQGLQAITSMFAIGPLLLGSAAIWLMTSALEKFKTVNWTTQNSNELGSVITAVLGSLSQKSNTPSILSVSTSMLANISAMLGAGSIFVGSAAIWLMSEALIKFKTVNWTAKDTASLSYTMSEILKVMSGSEEGGGLWSKIKSTAKSWLGTAASAGNATSLGLAGLSIGTLSDGLLKWRNLGWGPGQTKNLSNTIQSILFATSIKGNDNLFMLANNFNRIQNSMRLFKDHVNAMDIKKLTLTDSMMKSISIISKSPDAVGKVIQETIEKSFEKMTAAFIDSIKGTKTNAVPSGITNTVADTTSKNIPTLKNNSQVQTTKTQQPMFTIDEMQDAFQAALTAVTIKVKQVDVAF